MTRFRQLTWRILLLCALITPCHARVQLIELSSGEIFEVSAALESLTGLAPVTCVTALDTGGQPGDEYLLVSDGIEVSCLSATDFSEAFRFSISDLGAVFGTQPGSSALLTTMNPVTDARQGAADILLLYAETGETYAFDLESATDVPIADLDISGAAETGIDASGGADDGSIWRETDAATYDWMFSEFTSEIPIPIPLENLSPFPPAQLSQLQLPGNDSVGFLFLVEGSSDVTPTPAFTPTPAPSATPAGSPFWAEAYIVNGVGETISAVSRATPREVDNDIVRTGLAPNQILLDHDELFVVNSLSHSITVFDPRDLTVKREMSAGIGGNPFLMTFVDESLFYVTMLLDNQVALMHRTEGLIRTLDLPGSDDLPHDPGIEVSYARPSTPVLIDGIVYVSCSNLGADWAAAGPGVIARFHAATHDYLGMFESNGRNTLGMTASEDHPGTLFVANAGDYDGGFQDNGAIGAYLTQETRWLWSAPIADAPQELLVVDDILIAASAARGRLLFLDAATGSIRNSLDLPGGQELSFASALAADDDGNVWVTELNHDQLFIVDPRAPAILEGPYTLGDAPDAICILPVDL